MDKSYYDNYKKEFNQAQIDGNFKMYFFDVKNSKLHSLKDQGKFYDSMRNFVTAITTDLLEKEKATGKKILHRDYELEELQDNQKIEDKVVLLKNQDKVGLNKKVLRDDQFNPLFWLGDQVYFIVEKNSITDNEFFEIVSKHKDGIIPNYDLHFAHALYHTDKWFYPEGQLSRVYLIPILDYLAKINKNKLVTKENGLGK